MLFMNYAECPCCGKLIDDGAIYRVEKTDIFFLVCFDCDESLSKSDIKNLMYKKLKERKNEQ